MLPTSVAAFIASDRVPLFLCFTAFVLTFIVTRVITRRFGPATDWVSDFIGGKPSQA